MKQNKDGRARQARRRVSECSGELLTRASSATGRPTRIYDASDLAERGLYTDDYQRWLNERLEHLRDPLRGPSLDELLSERYDAVQARGKNLGKTVVHAVTQLEPGRARKPGPDGWGELLKKAAKAIGKRRPGELKKQYRERMQDWMKENEQNVVMDDNTFRKYGF